MITVSIPSVEQTQHAMAFTGLADPSQAEQAAAITSELVRLKAHCHGERTHAWCVSIESVLALDEGHCPDGAERTKAQLRAIHLLRGARRYALSLWGRRESDRLADTAEIMTHGLDAVTLEHAQCARARLSVLCALSLDEYHDLETRGFDHIFAALPAKQAE